MQVHALLKSNLFSFMIMRVNYFDYFSIEKQLEIYKIFLEQETYKLHLV